MFIKKVKPEFYNPSDTAEILKEIFTEEQKWEKKFDKKTNKEKEYKIAWNYKIEKGDMSGINLNLLFNKIIPHPSKENQKEQEEQKEQKEQKSKHLELLVERSGDVTELLKEIKKRIEGVIEWCGKNNFLVKSFSARCTARMIIGLGGVHPHETSMTLHHIYGVPYIPGSAIKGLTRHYKILELSKGETELLEKISKALESGKVESLDGELKKEVENLIEIFGTQKKEGRIIFMDAYPEDEITFRIDIMNPHYPDYYSGDKPPADWQNPRPIKFLTVENTSFKFSLLSLKKDNKDNELLEDAATFLQKALENYGIGAKTSLGYGIFKISQQ